MKINFVGYKLNSATASDAQVEFASDPDGITHNSNGITHQNLLSSWMIEIRHKEVSVLSPPMDPRIDENNQLALSISTGIKQAPHMLNFPALQEIVANVASKNTGENRTPRQVSRAGVDVTTPVLSEIIGTSTPPPSEISGTSSAPPSGGL